MAFNPRRLLPSTAFVAVLLIAVAAVGAILGYAGFYNIGADAPHSSAVFGLLQDFRENSITRHSRDVRIPKDLSDPKRIEAGAGLYQEMCTGCHLGPGVEPTELSQGLYPQAPELAKANGRPPAQQFWIIKHGVKLSAMPAWGRTHNDDLIWDMVAFIRQLPKMTPDQYKAAIASAPADHEELMAGMHEKEARGTASQPHHHHEKGAEHDH